LLLRSFPLWSVTAAPPVAQTTTALTQDLSLDATSVRVENYSRISEDGSDAGIRHSAMLTQSTSAGAVVLQPLNVTSTLAFRDGLSLSVSPRYVTVWVEDDGEAELTDRPSEGLASAIDGAVLENPPAATAGRYRFTFLEVREDLYAARATESASLDMTLELQAYRHTIVARVPLDVGSRARSPRYAVEFVGATTLEDGLAVDIRETYFKEAFSIPPTFFVLRNRRLKQAVLAANRWEQVFRSGVFDYYAPVVTATRLEMRPRAGATGGLTLDRAWLKDAELLVLKPEALGQATTSIRIGHFTLAPPAKAPQQR
jgi:hypothetical protein